MRLAGWFDRAAAVLVGRTNAPDHPDLTQREAVLDALGRLDLPIVWDLEIGHVPPHLPLVNGALARVVVDGDAPGDHPDAGLSPARPRGWSLSVARGRVGP